MVIIPTGNIFPTDLGKAITRTPGLHLSQIYNDLEQELFHPRTTDNPLWAQGGFIWEETLTMAFKQALGIRPGEVFYDGVIGSPDGYSIENGYIDEYKCTWKSANKTLDMKWKWHAQCMGYCKMIGGISTVRFRIFYINGRYNGDGPLYEDTYVYYEQTEIENNWRMLTDHAKSKGWL